MHLLSAEDSLQMAGILGVSPQRRFKGMYQEYTASLRSRESFKKELVFRHYWPTVKNLFGVLLVVVSITLIISAVGFYGSTMLLGRANELGRQCLRTRRNPSNPQHMRFAMVTCSDGSARIPGRSFEGVMELVTPNKKAYVAKHGYEFIDASDLLDPIRPPSWSKVLAVKEHLPKYDWVFWNDAVCVCIYSLLLCTLNLDTEVLLI